MLSLTEPIDVIFANFSTSHRRYIKKAVADGIKCYNNNDRMGFIEFYNDFTKRKNLYTLNLANLEEFSNKEWKYSYAEMNGQILAAHSYLLDNKSGIVRLMESGSLRLNDQYDTSKIAQANKLPHPLRYKIF